MAVYRRDYYKKGKRLNKGSTTGIHSDTYSSWLKDKKREEKDGAKVSFIRGAKGSPNEGKVVIATIKYPNGEIQNNYLVSKNKKISRRK